MYKPELKQSDQGDMVGFGRWNCSTDTTLEIGEHKYYYMKRYGTLNKFLSC
jgi:hypothetical protein